VLSQKNQVIYFQIWKFYFSTWKPHGGKKSFWELILPWQGDFFPQAENKQHLRCEVWVWSIQVKIWYKPTQ
jgi:hypothetical protein